MHAVRLTTCLVHHACLHRLKECGENTVPIIDVSHGRLKAQERSHVRVKIVAVTVPWKGTVTFIGPSPCGCEYTPPTVCIARVESAMMMMHVVVVMIWEGGLRGEFWTGDVSAILPSWGASCLTFPRRLWSLALCVCCTLE